MQKLPRAFMREQLLDVLIGKSRSINKKGAKGALQSDALWSQTGRTPSAAGIGPGAGMGGGVKGVGLGLGLCKCDAEDFGELWERVSSESGT